MNISITIPDSQVPAWQHRLSQYNAGSGQPALTLEQFAQLQVDEDTARFVEAHQQALRDLMKSVADELIAASGGDTQKLVQAVEAGKTAALELLT